MLIARYMFPLGGFEAQRLQDRSPTKAAVHPPGPIDDFCKER